MKVKTYSVNTTNGKTYGLVNVSDDHILYHAPNNWKTEKGAKHWAVTHGYEVVEEDEAEKTICTKCGKAFPKVGKYKLCEECREKKESTKGTICICLECGQEFVKSHGNQKICADCAAERKRRKNRELAVTKRNPHCINTCKTCGISFVASRRNMHFCCDGCKIEYYDEYSKNYYNSHKEEYSKRARQRYKNISDMSKEEFAQSIYEEAEALKKERTTKLDLELAKKEELEKQTHKHLSYGEYMALKYNEIRRSEKAQCQTQK